MSKISVSMGLNVQLRKESHYDRFTPSVTIAEIDTEIGETEEERNKYIKEQIQISLDTAKKMWDAISDFLEKQIEQEIER